MHRDQPKARPFLQDHVPLQWLWVEAVYDEVGAPDVVLRIDMDNIEEKAHKKYKNCLKKIAEIGQSPL